MKTLILSFLLLGSGAGFANDSYKSCEFNGKVTSPMESAFAAYKQKSVSLGERCEKEYRFCRNGILTGSYSNSFCSDLQFVPNTTQSKEQVDMVVGKVRGMPGIITADNKIMVKLGKAKSWNEARNYCRKLSPEGKWDLPDSEVGVIPAYFIDKDVQVTTNKTSGIYVLWTRHDLENVNKKEFVGKSIALAMADGEGFDTFGVDLKNKQILRRYNTPLPTKVKEDLFKKLDGGLTTYCQYYIPVLEKPENELEAFGGSGMPVEDGSKGSH